jgi:hypothetical protein
MEIPESFEDAVMVCNHDSVREAWLLTQSNLRNDGVHTHLVVIQRLSPALQRPPCYKLSLSSCSGRYLFLSSLTPS